MTIETNAAATGANAAQNVSRAVGPETEPQTDRTENEKLETVARRILREHRAAFEELAK